MQNVLWEERVESASEQAELEVNKVCTKFLQYKSKVSFIPRQKV
jgi:hypothetical protein